MSTEPLDVRSIFDRALELASDAERRAYLDQACAGAADVRQRVEALLQSYASAGSFLVSPPTRVEALAERLRTTATDASSLAFLTPSAKSGSLGRLGHYEIVEVVGSGGMGIVFKAFDEKLQRIVAIKAMAESLAASPAARKRFIREAQAAAAVRNDHVVSIYAVEESDQRPYLVMEFISGVSVQEQLDKSGPLAVEEILRIGMQIARGLAAAHAQGVIHRDIKPANILLENGVQRVKITDFGLAHVADDASLSQSGLVAGTPQYMSPEQARGESVDHRSDLFSLGSVLYAMCTGHAPLAGSTAMAVLRRVADEQPPPIRELNSNIPVWLIRIIDRLLAKQPADRFESAAEVADLLEQSLAYLQHPSRVDLPRIRRTPQISGLRPTRWWIAAAAAVAVLLTGAIIAGPEIIIRIRAIGGEATEIKVPRGAKVEIEQDGKIVAVVPRDANFVGELRRFEGHTDRINSVAFSPDGRHAVSAGWDDKAVILWDLETGKELRRLEGHNECVSSLAFFEGGRYVVGGGQDKTLLLWDVATGTVLRRFVGHTGGIWAVAVSHDGRRLLSGGKNSDPTVRLWDVETASELRRFEGPTQFVVSVAFSPDGRRALAGGWDKVLWVWDVETGQQIQRLEGHADVVEGGAFLPDGNRVLSCSRDRTLRLWDVATGQELRRYIGHRQAVNTVALSPDGRRAVSGSSDGDVLLWDVETAKVLHAFEGHLEYVICVAYSPDGRRALSGGSLRDKTVRLWQLPPEEDAAKQQ